jgi:hypothetical protein
MRVDSGGNVGIATTAPAQRLHIGLTGANNYIQFGTTNEGFVIGRENATGEFTFDATQGSPYNVFKWRQSGTERMRIAADGNVGIGAVPITKLHIQGHNSDVNTELRIEHPFAGGSATAALRFKRNSSDFAYMGGAALSISGGAVDDLGIAVVSGKNIVFGVNAAERMRINSDGNVGIGTNSPQMRVDVSGGLRVQSISNPSSGSGMELAYDGTQGIIQAYSNRATLTPVPVYLVTGQLRFPPTQNPSTDANTLDDYEEGTWTPTGPTGFPAGGINVSIGTYTKVGNVVHAYALMTAKTDGTTILIGGLPFATSYYEAVSISHETLTVRYERMLSGESGIRCIFSGTQTAAFQEIFIQATYRV